VVWFKENDAITFRLINPDFRALNNNILLQLENNEIMAIKYFVKLETRLLLIDNEVDKSPTKSVVKPDLNFITDTWATAAVTAFFKRRF
jgi:hypothetical protein